MCNRGCDDWNGDHSCDCYTNSFSRHGCHRFFAFLLSLTIEFQKKKKVENSLNMQWLVFIFTVFRTNFVLNASFRSGEKLHVLSLVCSSQCVCWSLIILIWYVVLQIVRSVLMFFPHIWRKVAFYAQHLPSDRTSYASDISRKRRFASSKLFGFLSGCHFNANFLYLHYE